MFTVLMILVFFVGILVTVALVVAILAALKPNDFRVSRSGTVNAPPREVFEHVNDFHKWQAWSPWAKRDPHARNTYEGPTAGVGAIFKWDGDKNVGSGQMTITESRPGERILMKLEFFRPFKGLNETEFTFQREGNQTVVTWTMTGNYNFLTKAFSLFVSMDKMVGGDFEKGLAAMKAEAEAAGAKV